MARPNCGWEASLSNAGPFDAIRAAVPGMKRTDAVVALTPSTWGSMHTCKWDPLAHATTGAMRSERCFAGPRASTRLYAVLIKPMWEKA